MNSIPAGPFCSGSYSPTLVTMSILIACFRLCGVGPAGRGVCPRQRTRTLVAGGAFVMAKGFGRCTSGCWRFASRFGLDWKTVVLS